MHGPCLWLHSQIMTAVCKRRATVMEAPKRSMLASVFGDLRQSIFGASQVKNQVRIAYLCGALDALLMLVSLGELI